MSDTFQDVTEAATISGILLGAPDYLDRDEQLDIALRHIADLHEEIARLTKAADQSTAAARAAIAAATVIATGRVPDSPTRRSRIASALARLKAGKLSVPAFARTVGWIVLRSEKEARERALLGLNDTVSKMALTSKFAGDKRVRDLLYAGRYDEAYVLARALMPQHGKNKRFVALARDVQTKRGAITSVLALTRHLATLDNGHTSKFAIRKVEGRLREISGWYPQLPGPVEPIAPVDETTVLHLVKESRPYLSNGFTSRSHRNFLAEAAAGLRPVVLTEPGFPRRTGVEDVKPVEFVDGIEHRRLDAGIAFTADIALDTYLQIFAQEALAVVKDVRPAVLHASSGRRGYETALVTMALAEKTGLPFVYEVRSFFESLWTGDLANEETGETFLRRLAVEQMCIERADVVLTLSESMSDELVRRGADPAKIHLVPNGVDLDDFQPVPRPADLADALGIGDAPTFGYVSNLDHPRESQETLVRATAVLAQRGRDVRCVLVGGGPRLDVMADLASTLGVADKVVLTGPVDHHEIAQYYGLIDVFVVPRIDERAARYVTPLKPFEAMALAKPLIVSDLPALREVADPPTRGLTFPPGNHDALADQIETLLDDPQTAATLGQAGLDWVTNERQWSMNGERYAKAFALARNNKETFSDAR